MYTYSSRGVHWVRVRVRVKIRVRELGLGSYS